MGCLGNILWFLFGGLWQGLSWTLAGVLWSMTIIGIPIGRQCFKLASLAVFPFWQRGSVWRQYPFGNCQHLLDDFQRNPAGDCSPLKRPVAVLYHYWHSVWDAVLQNGEAGAVSLWGCCYLYIRKEAVYGTNFSRR